MAEKDTVITCNYLGGITGIYDTEELTLDIFVLPGAEHPSVSVWVDEDEGKTTWMAVPGDIDTLAEKRIRALWYIMRAELNIFDGLAED